jgi:hypothetical protein
MRALVTSTRAPHALTAVRELGRRGWQITAADCTRLSYGARSRHVDRFTLFPELTLEPDAWQEALLAELER